MLSMVSPACKKDEGQAKLPSAGTDRSADVPLLVVSPETIRIAIKATGTTQPIRAANLGPQATARIEELMVDEGDVVEKGQTLVRLDVQGARLQAAQAQAAAAAVKAQAQLAEADYQRLAPLAASGTISAQRGPQLKAQRDALASSAKAAEAAAAQARRGITNTTVRAPFAGTISSVFVEVGEIATMVPPKVLVRLVDISELEVRIQVNERDLGRIAKGDEVSVTFPSSGNRVTGTVTYISPEIQAHSRAAEVVTRITNVDRHLRAGLFAEIEIAPTTSRQAIVVPVESLGGTGESRFVYVVKGGVAHRISVQVLSLDAGRVEILSGLKDGERIVQSGLHKVTEGITVNATTPHTEVQPAPSRDDAEVTQP
tara:strand:+ start:95645 stop:96757 length:1113 start_codon:yes stop_codon:yes gene_type:complete